MCKGNGWTIGRLVGSPREMPTRSQKWLRDKNCKFYNGRRYQRGSHKQLGGGGGGKNQEVGQNRKEKTWREKEKVKRLSKRKPERK